MFFYLIFAIALRVSHQYRAEIATALLSLIYLITQHADSLPFSAYSSNIVFEFVLGMIVYELLVKRELRRALVMFFLVAVSLILAEDFSGRFFLLGLPSALFVLVSVHFFERMSLPRFVAVLGGYSYSLYLTHPYIIQFFDKITKWFSMGVFYQASALLISLLLVNLVAFIFYKTIEIPTTKYLRALLVKSQ